MKVPFQIYDFIAILFPAVVLVTFFQFEWPEFRWSAVPSNFGGLAVVLVFIYLLGQFLNALSLILERKFLLRKSYPGKPREGYMCIRAGKSDLYFPINKGEAILKAVREYYGFEVPPDSSELFNLVYSPVYNRMAKREMFLALSSLMRNLITVGLICIIYLIGKVLVTAEWVPNLFLVLVFGLSLFVFRNQYLSYLRYSEAIPFSAFLSWYREMIFLKEKDGGVDQGLFECENEKSWSQPRAGC